jgi:hypothetical protein
MANNVAHSAGRKAVNGVIFLSLSWWTVRAVRVSNRDAHCRGIAGVGRRDRD